MQVEVTPADGGKARLDITLDAQEVDSALDSTYKRLSQRVRVPGFRPGHAPRALLLRTYGDEAFYHRATEEGLKGWYGKALVQSGLKAVDQGDVDLADGYEHLQPGQEFAFVATVATKPEIDLPDYSSMEIPAPPVDVSEADVDTFLNALRTARASLEPAPARPAAVGDVVQMNIHGRSGGKEVIADEHLRFELVDEDEGPDEWFPGLSEELVEARVGDIREVTLNLPADYQVDDLAGHSLSLQIVVTNVLRKALPDLNDDFVKDISRTTQTVSELRALIRHNLEHERLEEAANKVAKEAVDALIARASFQVPEIMISDEQDRMMRRHRGYFEGGKLTFEEFLVASRKSEEQYRDELRPAAERSVKSEIILDAVAKSEGLEPDPEAVDRDVRRMSEVVSKSERDAERLTGSRRLHETVAEDLTRRLALRRLVELTSGLKPALDEHEAGDEQLSVASRERISQEPPEEPLREAVVAAESSIGP